jgi:hypothetical protein
MQTQILIVSPSVLVCSLGKSTSCYLNYSDPPVPSWPQVGKEVAPARDEDGPVERVADKMIAHSGSGREELVEAAEWKPLRTLESPLRFNQSRLVDHRPCHFTTEKSKRRQGNRRWYSFF